MHDLITVDGIRLIAKDPLDSTATEGSVQQ
jgi:hypothetical protein